MFLVALLAVQWPFATFLMSTASMNRIFGTIYFDFYTTSHSWEFRRLFYPYERTAIGFVLRLFAALILGIFSTRLGLAWGGAVARVKR